MHEQSLGLPTATSNHEEGVQFCEPCIAPHYRHGHSATFSPRRTLAPVLRRSDAILTDLFGEGIWRPGKLPSPGEHPISLALSLLSFLRFLAPGRLSLAASSSWTGHLALDMSPCLGRGSHRKCVYSSIKGMAYHQGR